MAFYLNKLLDGRQLPRMGKTEFLKENVPGCRSLGSAAPASICEDLICIVTNVKDLDTNEDDFQAACWIDIPRQFEICSDPFEQRDREWLVVPGVRKMVQSEWIAAASVSEVKNEIRAIVRMQYNDYNGRKLRKIKWLHLLIRLKTGRKKFLEFLYDAVAKNPKPIYKVNPNIITHYTNSTKNGPYKGNTSNH